MTSLKVFLRYSFPAGLALIPLCSVKVVPAQRHGDQEATYLYYCFTHRGKDCRFASEKEAAEQYEKVKRCKPTKKDRDSIIPNEYARRRLQIMMPALKEFSPGHYNCTVCWPPPLECVIPCLLKVGSYSFCWVPVLRNDLWTHVHILSKARHTKNNQMQTFPTVANTHTTRPCTTPSTI